MRSVRLGGGTQVLIRAIMAGQVRRATASIGLATGAEMQAARAAAEDVGANIVLGEIVDASLHQGPLFSAQGWLQCNMPAVVRASACFWLSGYSRPVCCVDRGIQADTWKQAADEAMQLELAVGTTMHV